MLDDEHGGPGRRERRPGVGTGLTSAAWPGEPADFALAVAADVAEDDEETEDDGPEADDEEAVP